MKHDYEAIILADSVSPWAAILNGGVRAGSIRLITFEVTMPRFILAELNTHKMISKNSASSRAIPVEKRRIAVNEHPFVPESFTKNQKGMQADAILDVEDDQIARSEWLLMRDACERGAARLEKLGTHKQHANRSLELWSWHTVILTGTDWLNFFNLRANPQAQPEMQIIATKMREAMDASVPKKLGFNDWHLPLVQSEELWDGPVVVDDVAEPQPAQYVSAGRCARVSYLTHDGRRSPREDVELAGRLIENGHMSPFEHVARPMTPEELERFDTWVLETDPDMIRSGLKYRRIGSYLGNFNGWVQLRKMIPGERIFGGGR